MKIIGNISEEIKEILDFEFFNIENHNKLFLLNNKGNFKLTFEDESKLFELERVNKKGDLIIIDLFEEISLLYKINNTFIPKKLYEKEKLVHLKKYKLEEIDPIDLEENFLFEIYKIYINQLSRNFHNKNIVLLYREIEEDYKLEDDRRLECTEDERKRIKKLNLHLRKLKKIFKMLLPEISIKDLNSEIFIENLKYRKIKLKKIEILKIQDLKFEVFKGEKQYKSINTIRYCFEESKGFNKDKLIIIFSAFATEGAKYNYIKTLKTVDCNKLFILDDYGTKGTYYFGINGEFSLEGSIMSLITNIMADLNVSFKNLIVCGTSKGGSAALYYGMKYNFGTIIVGAPQYRIGSYLAELSVKSYGEEIFGEINDKNRLKYDNLIRLVSNNKSKIYLITGEGDRQYKKILKDFIDYSEIYKLNLEVKMIDIENHNDIAKIFPEYLLEKLKIVLKHGVFEFKALKDLYKKIKIK